MCLGARYLGAWVCACLGIVVMGYMGDCIFGRFVCLADWVYGCLDVLVIGCWALGYMGEWAFEPSGIWATTYLGICEIL